MIYQLTVYYGAVLNGKLTYTMAFTMDNCNKFPEMPFLEDKFIKLLMSEIESDGNDSRNYSFKWLTKEEYEKRPSSKTKNTRITV